MTLRRSESIGVYKHASFRRGKNAEYPRKRECSLRRTKIWRFQTPHGFCKTTSINNQIDSRSQIIWGLLPPKNGEFALWPSTNGAIVHFLVLPRSLLSINKFTEYRYFSPSKPIYQLKYIKVSKMLYHWIYYWTHFVFVKHNSYMIF